MARGKPTEEEQKERQVRAQEWISFRDTFSFSQKMLADTLTSIDIKPTGKRKGISRRTVQQVEAAVIAPHRHTLDLFAELKRRHESNRKA